MSDDTPKTSPQELMDHVAKAGQSLTPYSRRYTIPPFWQQTDGSEIKIGGDTDAIKKMMENYLGTIHKNPYEGISSEELIETLEKEKSQLANKQMNIEYAMKLLEKAKFKKGDVAFNKDYGNVLIESVSVEGIMAEGGPIAKYSTLTLTGRRYFNVEELLPVTEATTILYKKTKVK